MYIKDSVIEARIEKDLEKQRLEGRIEEIEYQLRLCAESKNRYSGLRERLKRLREDLKLLQD